MSEIFPASPDARLYAFDKVTPAAWAIISNPFGVIVLKLLAVALGPRNTYANVD